MTAAGTPARTDRETRPGDVADLLHGGPAGDTMRAAPGPRPSAAEARPAPATPPPAAQRPAVAAMHRLTAAYALTLVVAGLIAGVSVTGLLLGPRGLYGGDPMVAGGIASAAAGIVVPGFLAHDGFNLAVALPLLLATVWLARRGALAGLLLWPGALVYMLYTYTQYLIGAPFGPLFLPYALIVVLSAYATICLVAGMDGDAVRSRLAGAVPARTAGGILVGLALLTIAQDASGAVVAALAGGTSVEPPARHVWIADLVIEAPAVLAGGVLLWRRASLGYVLGAGLLFQFGLTPVALAVIAALQPWLTVAPADVPSIAGLLVFAAAAFAPLVFFARGAHEPRPAARSPRAGEQR